MLGFFDIFAQAPNADPQPGLLQSPLLLFGVLGAILYFMMLRPQSRERKKRAEMIAAIKKNDRVVTIGGILGTVVSVKDNEVTLKVDESNNTKITFTKSSIQQVTASVGGE